METFLANFAGSYRREILDGKSYLVTPLSLIVPGVLNGSKGPLYYPRETIKQNYKAWNKIPLVAYHPTKNNVPVSANDPDILNESGLGFVAKPRIGKSSGSLVAEGWFDEERVANYDQKLPLTSRMMPRILAGKPIELSTGLFTQNKKAPPGVTFNGREYVEIVETMRPDHLAILPDVKGACSIKDGCGVGVTQNEESVENCGGKGGKPGVCPKQSVVDYLKKHGEVHTTEAGITSAKSLGDMRQELGYKKFDGSAPLKNPVHKVLRELLDSGEVEAISSGRGHILKLKSVSNQMDIPPELQEIEAPVANCGESGECDACKKKRLAREKKKSAEGVANEEESNEETLVDNRETDTIVSLEEFAATINCGGKGGKPGKCPLGGKSATKGPDLLSHDYPVIASSELGKKILSDAGRGSLSNGGFSITIKKLPDQVIDRLKKKGWNHIGTSVDEFQGRTTHLLTKGNEGIHVKHRTVNPTLTTAWPKLKGTITEKGKKYPTTNQLSHDDLRQKLSELIRQRFENQVNPVFGVTAPVSMSLYVQDVYDKDFVYQNGSKMYRLGYTTDLRNDSVSLSDEAPVEVKLTRQYKSVSNCKATGKPGVRVRTPHQSRLVIEQEN